MIYINVWNNEEEAIKLLAMGCLQTPASASNFVKDYKRASQQGNYPHMCVNISFTHTPYPACCALYTLAQARVSLAVGLPAGFNTVQATTSEAAISEFASRISRVSGGGTLVADRADGTGEQIPFLKKIDWSSVGMTLEPCISLNNPNYNSDVGVWLLRKHNGQVRRKLEDMK